MISPKRRMQLSELIAPGFYGVHGDMRAGRHDEYFLKGGRGSAKSSFASIELILCLLRDPAANAIVYRRIANTLRESVFEQVLWAVDALGLDGLFEIRRTPLELILKSTGQKILFRGADDAGKSKSLKLSRGYFRFLWFEEAAEFSGMEDIRTIKASVLRGVDRSITVYSYNPPISANSWINEEALIPRPGRRVHHSCYTQLPREWLGESFLAEAEALKQSNERAYRHMYLGEVTGAGGQVFDNLEIRPIAESEIMSMDRFFNGLDFGFAVDPDAYVRAAYDPRTRRLFILDEYFGVRTPVERLAGEVKKRAGGESVHCDSADPRMIQELRSRGIAALGAKKGPGSVREGIRWLQELGGIIIDPARCPNAAREFSGYEYEADGCGGFRADCPDKDNHLIDALRYAMEDSIRRRSAKTLSRNGLGI